VLCLRRSTGPLGMEQSWSDAARQERPDPSLTGWFNSGKGQRMKFLLIAICMACLAIGSPVQSQQMEHGTTFAVERTPQLVAIAIDSSQATIDGNTGKAKMNGPMCKVHASAGVVFIAAGLYKYSFSDRSSFSTPQIVGDALAANMPWSKTKPLLISKLAANLNRVLMDKGMAQRHKVGGSFLQVVMAGSDLNSPYMHVLQFVVSGANGRLFVTPHSFSCPGDCPGGHYKITARNHNLLLSGSAVADTTREVELDIASKDPEFMGPPQVISIDPNGQITWVDRPMFCPMVLSY